MIKRGRDLERKDVVKERKEKMEKEEKERKSARTHATHVANTATGWQIVGQWHSLREKAKAEKEKAKEKVKEKAKAKAKAKEKVKAKTCRHATTVVRQGISRQIAGHRKRMPRTEIKEEKARARVSVRQRHPPTRSLAGTG